MRELIVDNFAGGGGASTGIEMALGRSPDIAINHDEEALAMHQANHPDTAALHRGRVGRRPGGGLRTAAGRARVVLAGLQALLEGEGRQAGLQEDPRPCLGRGEVDRALGDKLKPRVIILENVEEFKDWGPGPRQHAHQGEDGIHLPALHPSAREAGLQGRGP
jgi:DNA (cytosine-5)-methyltransferase 1